MSSRILVVAVVSTDNTLSGAAREALSLGAELASAAGGQLVCALLREATEPLPSGLIEFPLDSVLQLADESIGDINGEVLTEATVAAVAAAEADLVLLTRDAWNIEVAPRTAARLGGASLNRVIAVDMRPDGGLAVETSAYGGSVRATYEVATDGPVVLALGPRNANTPGAANAEPAVVDLSLPVEFVPRVRTKARPVPTGPRLEGAPVVVAGGRGLGEAAEFRLVRELAYLMGGLPGASRAIVDNGWAEPAEQVGLTGALVSPNLYVAAGISGASQHMVGCSNARTIVAINTDQNAPIFNYARLGIVDDCRSVLRELIQLLAADGPGGAD